MEPFNPYVPPKSKRRKKPGRPAKPKPPLKKRGRKRIPRLFDEVPLGYAIRLYAPLEFDLIMQVVGPNGEPEADLVEAISYASTNPYFRTEQFRWQLIRYRQDGCTSEHPKAPPTAKKLIRAARKRNRLAKG